MQYRFLSGDDTSEFCRKVSAALAEGWDLYGSPCYAFDAAKGVMRCGQAVTKEFSQSEESSQSERAIAGCDHTGDNPD